MPELPEVETIACQLDKLVCGKQVRGLRVFDDRLETSDQNLDRRRLNRVWREGKKVVFELVRRGHDPLWLAVHLRMTGRLIWMPHWRSAVFRHLRASLMLRGGAVLFFDARRFGTLEVVRDLERIKPRGHDPTNESFGIKELSALLGKTRQEIKGWLLRQDRLVGLGNIYASEILFEARIDPRRRVESLTKPEIRRLHGAIGEVLKRAIENCGTTFSDFQDAQGFTGSYQQYLAVYQKEGQPCSRCDTPIERIVQQQRSTFFCARCQHNPRRPVY